MDALEAIRVLKARYFRFIDQQDWDGFRELFTEDVVVDVGDDMEAAGLGAARGHVNGRDQFVSNVRRSLAGVVSVHHGHMPELELTSETTARGIWAMADELYWPDGRVTKGRGHYYEDYAFVDGAWRIARLRLARLRVETT